MSELTHYGVLGMKWGVRKDRSGGTSRSKKTKEKGRIKNVLKTAQEDLERQYLGDNPSKTAKTIFRGLEITTGLLVSASAVYLASSNARDFVSKHTSTVSQILDSAGNVVAEKKKFSI